MTDKETPIEADDMLLKICLENPTDEHVTIVKPKSNISLKALLCDAMMTDFDLMNQVAASFAGVGAFMTDENWKKSLEELDACRQSVKLTDDQES